jgi:uncharacterized SAM-binding protein YcdF (DUF218 family)
MLKQLDGVDKERGRLGDKGTFYPYFPISFTPLHHFVSGLRARDYSRWLVMFSLVGIVLSLLVLRDVIGIWTYPKLASLSCEANTILVMGAAQYDGRPSPAFQRRLDKAHDLYEQGCAPNIIVTGGKRLGDRFSEGESGVRYLTALGVPSSALQSETKSVSSFENLELSRPLLASKKLTIVTDDLHAYRTQYLAQKLGYSAELATVVNPYKRFAYALRELMMLTAYHLGIVR